MAVVDRPRRRLRSRFAATFLALMVLGAATARSTTVLAQASLPYAELAPASRYAKAIDDGRALLQALMESSKAAGLSVAVAVDGDVVWAEGFGYADIESRVAVTPLTKFRIGSVSKPLTSMAVGLLYEQGKLDLDAPVQRYVPDFPVKQWPVTVRQAGGHIGGIRSYDYANYDITRNEFVNTYHYNSVKESLNIFKDSPLESQPGTKYLYSSNGFNLLSAVIEGASGQDYLSYMKEHVIEPLKLRSTVPDDPGVIVPYRTRFYLRGEDGRLANAHYADLSSKWAGGGWLSTPSDLVRWGSALLGTGFLKEDTRKILTTSQKTSDGRETGYGIGFFTGQRLDGRATYGHSGGSVGGVTIWQLFPDDGIVVAMNVNLSVGPLSSAAAETIEQAFAEIRSGTVAPAASIDAEGIYSFFVKGAEGRELNGAFRLLEAPAGYTGNIIPADASAQPARRSRSQDGSYGPPPLGDVSVVKATVRGNQVHVIGADSGGFIHIWFTLKGDTIDGRWAGRGMSGTLSGSKRGAAGPS